jgi:acetyl esterase/lipase/photosystem II stability/assembly factor-like uncharacterized protein
MMRISTAFLVVIVIIMIIVACSVDNSSEPTVASEPLADQVEIGASSVDQSVIEGFENPDPSSWEYGPGVTFEGGVLRIPAGEFAFLHGDWIDLSLIVKVHLDVDDQLIVQYNATDESAYEVRMDSTQLHLSRIDNTNIQELGSNPEFSLPSGWFTLQITRRGDSHEVTVNEQVLLATHDQHPLSGGGIKFQVNGGEWAEFDDLRVNFETEEVLTQPDTQAGGEETEPPGESLPVEDLVWVRTGGPPGGKGYDIRYNFTDPNIWYVTDTYSGISISYDNGLTWQPSNTGIPGQGGTTGDLIPVFCLTVDPHDSNIVWAGTQNTGHIYRSSDGGRTWMPRENGISRDFDLLTFRGFTVDPGSSEIVYAMAETTRIQSGGPDLTGGIVFKTTDRGENWEAIWDGGMPSSLTRYLWIDPRDPDVLYVSTGIFDRDAIGLDGQYPGGVPDGGLGVLKSTDGGHTWRQLGHENGLGMLYIGSLAMNPENPDILLAAAGWDPAKWSGYLERILREGTDSPGGIYLSTDGGETWIQTLKSPPELFAEAFSSVEICPSNPDIVYAGSDYSVHRSLDGGQTWTLVSGGPGGWGSDTFASGWPIDMQCDPRDPDRVFANNYGGGNFLSEDGGQTWVSATQGYTGADISTIAVDPNDRYHVYAVGPIAHSIDGGDTWQGLTHLASGGTKPASSAITVDPADSNHILAGGIPDARITESFDDGSSWELRWDSSQLGPENEGMGAENINVIVFAPSNPDFVYAATSTAGCMNLHEPCRVSAGVLKSQDGGMTWSRSLDEAIRDLSVLDIAVDPTDPKVVFAATESGLFMSQNGGEEWEDISPLANQRVRAVAVSPDTGSLLLAGVDNQGVYVSRDGGQTWVPGIAGLESNNSIHKIVFDPVDPNRIYLTDYFSGVYLSSDGGSMWQRITEGLTVRATEGLGISSDGRILYVGTVGGGVFRLDLYGQTGATESSGQSSNTHQERGQPLVLPSSCSSKAEFNICKDLIYGSYTLEGVQYPLLLDLFLPENDQNPVPLLMYIHGGGWLEGSKDKCPGETFVLNGYAVACVDYRLASYSLNCPSELTFPVQIQDLKSALYWLRQNADQYGFDADRIAAMGESSGGHLAALLGTSSGVAEFQPQSTLNGQDSIQAVVDWYGPVDITQGPIVFTDDPCRVSLETLNHTYGGEETQHFYWTLAWATFLGGGLDDPDILTLAHSASPLAYIDGGDPAFLILHGANDIMVPISQSETLYRALADAGIEVTFIKVAGFGHGFFDPDHEVAPEFLQPTLEFLDQNLGVQR